MAYRILLMLTLLLLNGFFAAAEVSLVSVRRSKLRALADKGQATAQTALNLLANPERLLSVTQVGVTLASLGVGWAGEDTLYQLLLMALHPVITPGSSQILHGVAFLIAFLLMSYAHVVIGEVVPKNLAIEKADRLAVLVAPVLLVFYRISGPFVYVVERSAARISSLLGLKGGHGGGGHSAEELKFIIGSSASEGHLDTFEQNAIQKLLELQDYSAREIMVPRNDMIAAPVEAGLDEILGLMLRHKYSRVPVYEDTAEKIVGILHYKDLMRVWDERKIAHERRRPLRPFRLRRLLRKPYFVPETKLLSQLIDEFRQNHTHMALVVDEFGTMVGLVTLEDTLEQIFGSMGDEHDMKQQKPLAEAPVLSLDGSTTIRDLETEYGIELPSGDGFETLAGFLLAQLGYIPKQGESIVHRNRTFAILEMDRNRIARVRISKNVEEGDAQVTAAEA